MTDYFFVNLSIKTLRLPSFHTFARFETVNIEKTEFLNLWWKEIKLFDIACLLKNGLHQV